VGALWEQVNPSRGPTPLCTVDGGILCRDGKTVRVELYKPEFLSSYYSLVPEDPGAEGQGEEIETAVVKKRLSTARWRP